MAINNQSKSKLQTTLSPKFDPLLHDVDLQIEELIAGSTVSASSQPPQAIDALDLIDEGRALAPTVSLSDDTGSAKTRAAVSAESTSAESPVASPLLANPEPGTVRARDAGADGLQPEAMLMVEVREAPPERGLLPSSFDVEIATAAQLMISGLTLQSLFRPKVADRTDLTVSISATADAVGTDTAVDVDIFGRLHDLGAVSFGYAAIKIEATAEAGIDDIAYAETFADIAFAGADFVFLFRQETSATLQSDLGTLAHDETTLFALAFDFERWDFRRGPIIVDGNSDTSFFGMVPDLPDLIFGNIATFKVDVEARGTNTYTDVDVSILSVEDRLSTVSALVEMGV